MLGLAAWASARNGMALRVIGRGDAAELVAKTLTDGGANAVERLDRAGAVRIEWVDAAGD